MKEDDPILLTLLRKYQETITYMGLVRCDCMSEQDEPLIVITQQRVYMFKRSIPKKQLMIHLKPSPSCVQSFHLFCLIKIVCMSPENITLRFVSQVNTSMYVEASIYSKHSVEILNSLRLSLYNLYYIHDMENNTGELKNVTTEIKDSPNESKNVSPSLNTLTMLNNSNGKGSPSPDDENTVSKRIEERIHRRVKIDAPEDALIKIPPPEKRILGGFLENYNAQCNYYGVEPSQDIKFCKFNSNY